jgi:hypothetical protein
MIFIVFLLALHVVMATPIPKSSWELLAVNPLVAKALAAVQGQGLSSSHVCTSCEDNKRSDGWSVNVTVYVHLVPRLKKRGALPSLRYVVILGHKMKLT